MSSSNVAPAFGDRRLHIASAQELEALLQPSAQYRQKTVGRFATHNAADNYQVAVCLHLSSWSGYVYILSLPAQPNNLWTHRSTISPAWWPRTDWNLQVRDVTKKSKRLKTFQHNDLISFSICAKAVPEMV